MIINGISWRVRKVSPTSPFLLTPHNTYALGSCDKPSRTIYINDALMSIKLEQVLCHEIAHAVMYSYGLELSYENEEQIASIISSYGKEILTLTKQIYRKMK